MCSSQHRLLLLHLPAVEMSCRLHSSCSFLAKCQHSARTSSSWFIPERDLGLLRSKRAVFPGSRTTMSIKANGMHGALILSSCHAMPFILYTHECEKSDDYCSTRMEKKISNRKEDPSLKGRCTALYCTVRYWLPRFGLGTTIHKCRGNCRHQKYTFLAVRSVASLPYCIVPDRNISARYERGKDCIAIAIGEFLNPKERRWKGNMRTESHRETNSDPTTEPRGTFWGLPPHFSCLHFVLFLGKEQMVSVNAKKRRTKGTNAMLALLDWICNSVQHGTVGAMQQNQFVRLLVSYICWVPNKNLHTILYWWTLQRYSYCSNGR